MAIDKIIPIRLDKSSDFKLVPKTSMVDALNMLITENESSGEANETGNLGVLKNIKGNAEISYLNATHAIAAGDSKIIGSVTDTKLKIIYFFVWHTNALEHGVYAYDQMGKLPISGDTRGKIVRIHKSDLYAFPEHGYVKGNIIYTSQTRLDDSDVKPGTEKDFEKDAILYFTDNTNEPRKLNVYQAMLGEDSSYGLDDKIDFITACPKTPLTPITFEFNADPSRTTSNFKSGPGFQFAYQFISKDGVESAISPYSDIAFSPSVINQGTLTNVNHNVYNRCALKIPVGGKEIEGIRVLARQFNNPELVILDEVSNTESVDGVWDVSSGVYNFYNDRIVRGVSNNEVNKQYDNLPRKAQAQSVVDNRLMYGNYLEGFDKVKTECNAQVNYESRPSEGFDFNLTLLPAISQIKDDGDNAQQGWDKCAGYILDTSSIPPYIPANTFISINISIAPENNFHVYTSRNSYHQSRHRGAYTQYQENEFDYDAAPTADLPSGSYGVDNSLHYNGEYGHQNVNHSGEKWLRESLTEGSGASSVLAAEFLSEGNSPVLWGIPYAGQNSGLANPDDPVRWKVKMGDIQQDLDFKVTYGTSAGNPLILSSKGVNNSSSFDFSCSFLFGANGVGSDGAGQQAIAQIVADLLTGGEDAATWSGGSDSGFITNITVNNKVSHQIDLGLQNFNKINTGDFEENLVSGVVRTHEGIEDDSEISGFGGADLGPSTLFRPPVGHFIVNKATVELAFERDRKFSEIVSDNPKEMIRLVINKIENVEAVTVVKKIFPGAPWTVLTKNYLNDAAGATVQSFNDGVSLSGDYDITGNGVDIPGYSYDEALGQSPDGGIFEQNSFDDFDYSKLDRLNTYSGTDFAIEGQEFINESGLVADESGVLQSCRDRFLAAGNGLGYLDFGDNFFNFNRDDAYLLYAQQQLDAFVDPNDILYIGKTELFPFSLLDGAGGPGGRLGYDNENMAPGGITNFGGSDYRVMRVRKITGIQGSSGFIPSNEVTTTNPSLYNNVFAIQVQGPIFTGTINTRPIYSRQQTLFGSPIEWDFPNNPVPYSDGGSSNYSAVARTYLPLLQGLPNIGLDVVGSQLNNNNFRAFSSPVFDMLPSPIINESGDSNPTWRLNFGEKHSYLEVLSNETSIGSLDDNTGLGNRTFKSSANHDFGITYYDERGRHGFVNHLKTVYVPGYSSAERGASVHGKSSITLDLIHEPPIWAHYYKIAYTKNTTVQSFIQYSVGGAFTELVNETDVLAKSNIYISLNYLQESSISYVSEWGARNPQGGLSMFKAIDGVNQKLRVISAYTDNNSQIWPYNYEFDIIDVVLLGDDEENPLMLTGEGDISPEKMGEFLVLRNNTSAEGFDFTSITSNNNRWENNCIVELFTPQKGIEEENRFYYEIGETYDINNPETSSATHSETSITLDKGDVWWRKVPVNLREYDSVFIDLIQESSDGTENSSTSNFKPIYLETETASDLFKADATLIGRPNIIVEDAVETIREASITYSGKSNPNSSKINYSSFNLTLSNFKELQEEFGDINYMCNMEGDVFVIQSDRCTLVPASKTLFSDVQGSSTVAASKSPLGQERVFAGRAGCDNNPESVVQVGAYVYFAHKNLGKVYRFNPSNGVQEISEQGMASYFRGLFEAAMAASDSINYNDVRVVGGFDPVNEEYLLTVLDPVTYGVTEGTGGGGMVEEGGGEGGGVVEVIEDFTTINSLEQQMYNVMEAFLSAEDAGGNPVFDVETLPEELRDFYKNAQEQGLTEGLDFDPIADGILEAGEVVSAGDISTPIQNAITDLVDSLAAPENTDLLDILDAIDNTGITNVEGAINYINTLEADLDGAADYEGYINSLVNKAFDLTVMLNDNRYATKLIATGETGYAAALAQDAAGTLGGGEENPTSIYNLLDNATKVLDYFRLLQTFLGGEDRVGVADGYYNIFGEIYYSWGNQNQPDGRYVMEDNLVNNYNSILGDFQTSLDTIYNTQLLEFQGDNTSGENNPPMQAVNTFLSDTIQGVILDNMEQADVPTAIVQAINAQFGTELTIDQIPSTLINTIQSNYITPNVGNNDITAAELQAANPDLYNEIGVAYLEANPQLQASLQTILQGIATSNNVEVSGVTGSMLTTWAGSQTSNGDGLYNSVAEAVAGEGISTNQIQDFLQQIALASPSLPSGGFDVTKWKADINGDLSIGSADLLLFLSVFGMPQSFDGSILWQV